INLCRARIPNNTGDGITLKLVDIVAAAILVSILLIAGLVSLTSLSGAVLPLFVAMVFGWAYVRCKLSEGVAGERAHWPIRRKKKAEDDDEPASRSKEEQAGTDEHQDST
ncbi:MAG: hypothetical protein ACFFDP_11290, partial [Promethearchaeota archaeon]